MTQLMANISVSDEKTGSSGIQTGKKNSHVEATRWNTHRSRMDHPVAVVTAVNEVEVLGKCE
jgi:hypothetical protein